MKKNLKFLSVYFSYRYIERNLTALQRGINMKADQLLANSLDGIPMLLRPTVYERCEQAAMLNFNIVNGEHIGTFLLEALPTKNLSHFLPACVVEHATLDSIEALQTEITNSELITQMIGGNSTNDIVPTIHFQDGSVNAANNIHDTSVLTAANILSSATTVNELGDINPLLTTPTTTTTASTTFNDASDINVIEDAETSVSNIDGYTVSFGDDSDPSFCTCSYWKQFKLPCVHMFYIFQKKCEWKYDMLSSLYRMNNALNQDGICGWPASNNTTGSNSSNTVERTQASLVNHNKCKCEQMVKYHRSENSAKKISVQTQKNLGDFGIFLPISDLNSSEKLFEQVNALIKQLSELSHVFRDLLYFKNLRKQLQQLSRSLWDSIIQEKISKNLSGDINKFISNYLTKVIEQTVETADSSFLTATKDSPVATSAITATTSLTAPTTLATTTTAATAVTSTASETVTEVAKTATKKVTPSSTTLATELATELTTTKMVSPLPITPSVTFTKLPLKAITTSITATATTIETACTISATTPKAYQSIVEDITENNTETIATLNPPITSMETAVTSPSDISNKSTNEYNDNSQTSTNVLDVLDDILSDAIQEDIIVETSDVCGDNIASQNNSTLDGIAVYDAALSPVLCALENVDKPHKIINTIEQGAVQDRQGVPVSLTSSSPALDTLLSTPVLKAQDIVISMLKSGRKRNSQDRSHDMNNLNDDEDFVKASFKTSILEYLPLLKKKCVDQPPKSDSV